MNIHDRDPTQVAPSLGGVMEAIYSLRDDVKEIRDSVMPRDEITTRLASLSERVVKMENSPQSFRAWLAVALAGLGCLTTLGLGIISTVVTILLATRK